MFETILCDSTENNKCCIQKTSGIRDFMSFATLVSIKPHKNGSSMKRNLLNDMSDSKLHYNQRKYQPQRKFYDSTTTTTTKKAHIYIQFEPNHVEH